MVFKDVVLPFFAPALLAAGYSIPKYMEYERTTMSISLGLMMAGVIISKLGDR